MSRIAYRALGLLVCGVMLVGLIAVICVAAVTLLGQDVSGAFSVIAASLSSI